MGKAESIGRFFAVRATHLGRRQLSRTFHVGPAGTEDWDSHAMTPTDPIPTLKNVPVSEVGVAQLAGCGTAIRMMRRRGGVP